MNHCNKELLVSSSFCLDMPCCILSNMEIPQIGEHYRHYKSTGGMDHVYEVVGIAKNIEMEIDDPDSIMIVYKPLYHADILDGTHATMFTRPLSLFIDELEIDGKMRPRFTKE